MGRRHPHQPRSHALQLHAKAQAVVPPETAVIAMQGQVVAVQAVEAEAEEVEVVEVAAAVVLVLDKPHAVRTVMIGIWDSPGLSYPPSLQRSALGLGRLHSEKSGSTRKALNSSYANSPSRVSYVFHHSHPAFGHSDSFPFPHLRCVRLHWI